MLDGDLTTGWSNYYDKSGTADPHADAGPPTADWVSVTWPGPQAFSAVKAFFTIAAALALPASIAGVALGWAWLRRGEEPDRLGHRIQPAHHAAG